MRFAAAATLSLALCLAPTHTYAQDKAMAQEAMQEKMAQLKASMAANKAKLQKYQWVESTEVSLKGEVRKDIENMCHYGPDGKVVKTPLNPQQAAAQKQKGGLRGRVVEKKKEEMTDYVERLKSLISRYVPPDGEELQAAYKAGKAEIKPGGSTGDTSLIFNDYVKAGDKVTLVIDSNTKKIQSFIVNTYLDDPKDVVNLNVRFGSLSDGTNHVEQTVLQSVEKQIQITTTNSNYALRA